MTGRTYHRRSLSILELTWHWLRHGEWKCLGWHLDDWLRLLNDESPSKVILNEFCSVALQCNHHCVMNAEHSVLQSLVSFQLRDDYSLRPRFFAINRFAM